MKSPLKRRKQQNYFLSEKIQHTENEQNFDLEFSRNARKDCVNDGEKGNHSIYLSHLSWNASKTYSVEDHFVWRSGTYRKHLELSMGIFQLAKKQFITRKKKINNRCDGSSKNLLLEQCFEATETVLSRKLTPAMPIEIGCSSCLQMTIQFKKRHRSISF